MTALAPRTIGWVPVKEACGERRACGEVFSDGGVVLAWGRDISRFSFAFVLNLY